jgi:membrane associated rhomboid family serine protease
MSDHVMGQPRAVMRDTSSLRAFQLFFALHCAGLLALKLAPDGEHGLRSILDLLAVPAGEPTLSWSLITHTFLHVHPLEFGVSVSLLLFLGGAVERSLGARRFAVLYLASAAASALAFQALSTGPVHASGAALAPSIYLGGVAAGCSVLVAYVLVEPRKRTFGVLPAPGFFVACATLVFVAAIYLEQEPARYLDESLKVAVPTLDSVGRWLDNRWEYVQRETVAIPHLLGFLVGGCVFAADLLAAYAVARVHVRRQIRFLEEELDARERVDALLEKISKQGVDALSRREKKFLKYASARFYLDRKRVLSE